jgi:hypothetical protein
MITVNCKLDLNLDFKLTVSVQQKKHFKLQTLKFTLKPNLKLLNLYTLTLTLIFKQL